MMTSYTEITSAPAATETKDSRSFADMGGDSDTKAANNDLAPDAGDSGERSRCQSGKFAQMIGGLPSTPPSPDASEGETTGTASPNQSRTPPPRKPGAAVTSEPPALQYQAPSFFGFIRDRSDADYVFAAAREGRCHVITQRLEPEANPVEAGYGFVYSEKSGTIKRWTDGLTWSESYHTGGKVLLYRQMQPTKIAV